MRLLRLTLTLAVCPGLTAGAIGEAGGSAGRGAPAPRVAASPAVGGACSKETAAQVMTQAKIGVDVLTGRTPIQQVLCGPFLGPGSSGMVASVAIPSCGLSIGWAVFRFDGTDWQLVVRQDHGAFLSKVGSDIRETIGVLRPGDAHCFPSAERSRVWHWNGTALAAGPWRLKELTVTRHLFYFASPSRNIYCSQGDEDEVRCATRTPRRAARLRIDGRVAVCNGPRCSRNEGIFNGAPVLAYGQSNDQSVYLCTSRRDGVTCVVNRPGRARGKGFRINRAGVTRVG
jgi:hypothetical protein